MTSAIASNQLYVKRRLETLVIISPAPESIEKAATRAAEECRDYAEYIGENVPLEVYKLAVCYFLEDILESAVGEIDWFMDKHKMSWDLAEQRARRDAATIGFGVTELPVIDEVEELEVLSEIE